MSKVRVVRQCLGVRTWEDQTEPETYNISSTPRLNEAKVSDMNLSDISSRVSALDEESFLNYQMLTIHPILRHEIELTQQNAKFRSVVYALVIFAIFLTILIVFARVSYVYSVRHPEI
jgi:predicted permease